MEITPGSAIRSLSTALNPSSPGADAPDVSLPLKAIKEIIDNGTMPLPAGVTGDSYFSEATKLFREAYDASPTNARNVSRRCDGDRGKEPVDGPSAPASKECQWHAPAA